MSAGFFLTLRSKIPRCLSISLLERSLTFAEIIHQEDLSLHLEEVFISQTNNKERLFRICHLIGSRDCKRNRVCHHINIETVHGY